MCGRQVLLAGVAARRIIEAYQRMKHTAGRAACAELSKSLTGQFGDGAQQTVESLCLVKQIGRFALYVRVVVVSAGIQRMV